MSGKDILSAALEQTGFEWCEFPPDHDPCEKCGKTWVQLYFGNRNSMDCREGEYRCAKCVIELCQSNQAAANEL